MPHSYRLKRAELIEGILRFCSSRAGRRSQSKEQGADSADPVAEEEQRVAESIAATSPSSGNEAATIDELQPVRPIAAISGSIASPMHKSSGFGLGRSLASTSSNMATALKQLDKSSAVNGFEEAEKDLKPHTLMASESERERLKNYTLPELTSLGGLPGANDSGKAGEFDDLLGDET